MFDVTCLDKYGNTVTHFTQWDLNQTLYIEDHGFTTPPQFHFCNMNLEKALVVSSIFKDGMLEVVVPNMLLVEPYTITVYVYLSENDSSKTVEYVQIPVRPRPQPDSFEYEDNVVLVDVQELANEIRALNEIMSDAEEKRVVSELNRISNETERQNAEADRKTSETIRISTETERVSAENIRKENEVTRIENEDTRKTAEKTRVDAEVERVNVENVRKENEANRLSAETDRSEAETERIEAETNRANAELERIEAESERSEAEDIRVTAENERVSAEVIRQSQEETRQTNTTIAISNAEVATNRANVAAEACEGIIEGTGLVPSTEKGAANGVATLDENGKVPLEQLQFDIATTEKAGIVKPDGTTITVDSDGTIHGNASITVDNILSTDSTNPIANKAVAESVLKNSLWNELTEGFDLNNALGKYRTSQSEIVATLLNKPSDVSNGEITVEWFPTERYNLFGLQILRQTRSTGYKMYIRYRQNTTWGEWEAIATNKDLENYLPNTGGDISGALKFDRGGCQGYGRINQDHNATTNYGLSLRDYSEDGQYSEIRINGANDKAFFRDHDGYSREMLHTGNMEDYVLPKTIADNVEIFVPYQKSLTIKTEYGASGSGMSVLTSFTSFAHSIGNAIVVNPSNITFSKEVRASQKMYVNNNEVLHAGNSAKVHIGTTAPNDTTGQVLFINTSA